MLKNGHSCMKHTLKKQIKDIKFVVHMFLRISEQFPKKLDSFKTV